MTEPKHSGQSEAVQLYNGMVGTGNSTIVYKVHPYFSIMIKTLDPNRSASIEKQIKEPQPRLYLLKSIFVKVKLEVHQKLYLPRLRTL